MGIIASTPELKPYTKTTAKRRDKPWAKAGNQKPQNPNQLANCLKKFKGGAIDA
jgi:hypothetical protein